MTLIRKINPTYLFWFCLLLALTLRVKYEINFPQLDSDYATETEAAKNFIEGNGFSVTTVNPSNLSEITYSPLTFWPVGYAMALIPLYYISGSFIYAAVLLQCISTLLLLFGFLRVFKVLGASKTTLSLFLLFYAFTPTPFSYLGTTDLLTGAFFMWIIAHSIELYNNDKTNWKKIIYISLLLLFSCMLRFACIPNIVIIPLFLFICSVIQKKYKLLISAATITVLSFTGIFIFFNIFKIDNSRTSFLQNLIHFNLYFKHLFWFDSFPIKALFFPRPFEYRLPHDLILIRIFRISLYLASLLFGGYLTYYFYKKIKNTSTESAQTEKNKNIFSFFSILLSSTFIICSFISMQSLTTHPENNSFGPSWMPRMWTFVYSTRYFVIPIIMFQVLFFMLLNDSNENILKNRVAKFATKGLFISSLLASVFQWSYTTKQYHYGNGAASFWHSGKSEIAIFNILNKSSAENPKLKTIYSCFNRASNDGGSMTLYSKVHVCRDYKKMTTSGFKHKEPVLLFILMPKSNLNNAELVFISTFKPEVVQVFEAGILYKAILT